ncbi:MAG: M23 family metallopeptidase [Alphaproteobacteria bacterium]
MDKPSAFRQRCAHLLRLALILSGPMALAACSISLDLSGLSGRAPASSSGTVTVEKGDTVYRIAKRNNVPLRDLIAANSLRPPYLIEVGQRLHLPRPQIHVVRKGDTLYSISRAYGVSMNSLARANGLGAPYTIYAGQKLQLAATEAGTAKRTVSRRAAALPAPPARTGKGFATPVKGRIISRFGPKEGGLHNDGINIAAPRGSDVRAAQNGVVAYADSGLSGFGNLLLIKHSDGWVSAYAHTDKMLVRRGDRVTRGQVIAKVGSTGSVDRPQLHFELRRGSRALDPLPHLDGQLAALP